MAQMVRTSTVVSAMFLLSMQMLHFKITLATTYTVGDDAGWSFNVEVWPQGKNFMAGDQLEFKYDPSHHNVVAVDQSGYDSCTKSPPNAKVYQTGNDMITLRTGPNYFICGFPGHCSSGMKIAIDIGN